MAVHHVLCIHGIGKHSNDWVDDKDDGEQSLAELLKLLWEKYPATRNKGAFAHSMGTAMAHKVIQALYNEGVDTPMGRQTLKGDCQLEHLCMVANTSLALSRDRKNHYKGIVRPSLTAGAGVLLTFDNIYSIGIARYGSTTGVFLTLDLANCYRDELRPSYESFKGDLSRQLRAK